MNIHTLKNKSGFKLALDRREIAYDSEGYEGAIVDIQTLIPKHKKEPELHLVNLNDLYESLLNEVIDLKDSKTNLEESVLKLANKWGHLRIYSPTLSSNLENVLEKIIPNLVINQPSNFEKIRYAAHCKLYSSKNILSSGMTYAEEEFFYWKVLLTEIIPSSQSWLKPFMDKNGIQLNINNLNACIKDGIDIKYKSLKRSSYDMKPTNMLSAITIFSRTKRPRIKKTTSIICAYGPCQNEVPNNLGKGRARITCSDSCRTLKARHRTK